MKHQTKIKMIRAGDRLEITRFEKPIEYGGLPQNDGKVHGYQEKTKEEKMHSRHISSKRAKKTFERLVYANIFEWLSFKNKRVKPTLLTLTFKKNFKDIKKANLKFTKFLKRLNYEIVGKKVSFLKYITAIEFQKRGAVHYHVLFFNYSYVPKEILSKLWREGFVHVKRTKGKDTKEIISYLTKYLIKDLESSKLDGKKSYFASRDLKKPIITRNEERNDFFISIYKEDLILAKEFEKNYKSEYCGELNYSVYDLSKSEKLKKGILAFEGLLRYNE